MYDKKFFDIKSPEHKAATPRVVQVPQHLPSLPMLKNKIVRRIGGALVMLVSVVLAVSLFGAQVIWFKDEAVSSAPKIYADFKDGAQALFGFDLDAARVAFGSANQQVANLNAQAPLRAVPGVLGNLFSLSQGAVNLSARLADLQTNGLSLALSKRGSVLIEKLRDIQGQLSDINLASVNLNRQAEQFGYHADSGLGDMSGKIIEADQFLTSLLGWLDSGKKERLLVFFQNPSEMRPGGGFIGSYGVATIFKGSLLNIQISDIYDPDGQLDLKVIPPKPLQGITGKWGARDANWFFDFPTSAAKVTKFLEASKIYSEQGVTFSGAVAVNVEVLKDVLEVVGPVDLPEYKLTVNGDNVLKEIQKEVEAGNDKAKGEPKRILKVLSPILFEKLANLTDEQKQDLRQRFSARISAKDVMAYFKDPAVEAYLEKMGVAGEVAVLPNDFFGDYLAVVNASVGGGKSDAMIDQKITLKSSFELDGRIRNRLTITRTHGGDKEKEWWYRATNHDYLQIYVPAGADLIKRSGSTPTTVTPLLAYTGTNFTKDPDLVALEKNDSAAGKDIFTAWLDTKAGETKKITFDYYSPYRFDFEAGGYQFIFDKQSGSNGTLEVELQAPKGFQWRESGSALFTVSLKDVPARLTLPLNLEPVAQ